MLRREINSIRELHDTEPDSKCTFLDPAQTNADIELGCMNALANYLLLQSRTHADKFKSTRLREEAKQLFGRLEEVDQDRKERYRDMAAAC